VIPQAESPRGKGPLARIPNVSWKPHRQPWEVSCGGLRAVSGVILGVILASNRSKFLIRRHLNSLKTNVYFYFQRAVRDVCATPVGKASFERL
jgi:hypothetical protein